MELFGHRYLGKKQGDCVKCGTGNILSVGFLELFVWEHVALVPGGFCGTACRPKRGWVLLLLREGWEQRGSSRNHEGQPVASATPQWQCQCGVAWIRKDPTRVLVGVCVSIGICNEGMFIGHASPSSSIQTSALLLPSSEARSSRGACAASRSAVWFQQGSLAMKSPSCSSAGVWKGRWLSGLQEWHWWFWRGGCLGLL